MSDNAKLDFDGTPLQLHDERYLCTFLFGKPDQLLARVRVTDLRGPTKTYVEAVILGTYSTGVQQYGYRVGEILTPGAEQLTTQLPAGVL